MPAALKRPAAAVDRELGSETAASGSEGEVIRSLEKAVTKQELASVTPKAKVQANLAAKSKARSMAPPAAVPTRRAKTEPQDDERDAAEPDVEPLWRCPEHGLVFGDEDACICYNLHFYGVLVKD
jgi:biotin carboxylase